MTATDFDSLDATAFERFANDLLFAETRGHGACSPNPTAFGVTDGGKDAAYEGPWPPPRGVRARWKVSAKRVGNASKLRATLRTDFKRYPHERWLIFTNINPPAKSDTSLRDWVEQQAPGSVLVLGPEVTTLLDRHPYVARTWELRREGACLGFDTGSRWAPQSSLPTNPPDALDQIFAKLADGDRAIDVVGVAGLGQRDLARQLVRRAHDVHAGAPGGMFPLLVTALDTASLETSLRHEVRLGQQPYLFVVPPGANAASVAQSLRRMQPALSDSASVAFVDAAEHYALQRPPAGGFAPSCAVVLSVLTDQEAAGAWLRAELAARRRSIEPPVFQWLLDHCDGRVGLATALLDRGVTGTEGELGASLRLLPQRGAADLAVRLLLTLPEGAGWGGVPDATIEGMVPNAETNCGEIAEALLPGGILFSDRGRVLVRDTAAVRAIARLCRGPANALRDQRLHRDIATLSGEPRIRACVRAALWLEDEEPARELIGALSTDAASAVGHELESAVSKAKRLTLGPASKAAGRALAHQVLGRFVADASVADAPAFPDSSLRSLARKNLAWRALELYERARGEPGDAAAVLQAALRLAESSSPPTDRDFVALGRSLANPWAGPDGLLDALEADSTALSPGEGTIFASILRGAAEVLLARGVAWSNWSAEAVSIHTVGWNEANGKVNERRVRLVELAAALSGSGDRVLSDAAWAVISGLWCLPDGLGGDAPMPGHVAALAHRTVDVAHAAMMVPDAWEEWARAEWVVLRATQFPEVNHDVVAGAIRHFNVDPCYLLWRLITRPGWVVRAPGPLAEAVGAGGGWPAVCAARPSDRWKDADAVGALVCALRLTAEATVALLRRVDAWEDWRPLAAWMRGERDLFIPILTGDCPGIPERLYPLILVAGLRAFPEELRSAMSGRGAIGGLAGRLRQLVNAPEEATAEDAGLIWSLPELVDPADYPPLLVRLAARSTDAVRRAVAQQLVHGIRYRAVFTGRGAVAAVVAGLASGEGAETGIQALLVAAGEYRGRADPLSCHFDPLVGEMILARVPGQLWHRHVADDGRAGDVCILGAMAESLIGWDRAAARASLAAGDSLFGCLDVLVPDAIPAELAVAALDHARVSSWAGTDLGVVLVQRLERRAFGEPPDVL